MSRTLVAGAMSESHVSRSSSLRRQQEIDITTMAMIWGCFAGMWGIAGERVDLEPEYATLMDAQTRLGAKLARPELADHPLRPKYTALYDERAKRMRALDQKFHAIDVESRQYRDDLARHWTRISPEHRAYLTTYETGWPKVEGAERFAEAVWQAALRRDPMPSGGME